MVKINFTLKFAKCDSKNFMQVKVSTNHWAIVTMIGDPSSNYLKQC